MLTFVAVQIKIISIMSKFIYFADTKDRVWTVNIDCIVAIEIRKNTADKPTVHLSDGTSFPVSSSVRSDLETLFESSSLKDAAKLSAQLDAACSSSRTM